MYKNGYSYSIIKKYMFSIITGIRSLTTQKGFLDGFSGIYLSYFYAWYTFNKWQSLKSYQENIDRINNHE